MKLISWNVNGLRACIQKGFLDFFQQADADFFCLQETKLSEGQMTLSLPGYHQYWCYADKKGYSGTAIFTKHKPLSVTYGIGVEELDNEGRVITLEYPEFYLVNCYTPNAQRGLARLDYRMKWDESYRTYIVKLDAVKPVILCGDLNVAHKDIDLKNPSSNRQNAGFSLEERESFSKTLSLGFTDTFRHLHPDITGVYTWWSYMYHARENNAGWRIDYFLVSNRIRDRIYSTPIYSDVLGSDHCPVGLELDISCNGSIWHESTQGDAQVVSSDSKPKRTAVKVISLILALVLLLGIGTYFAGNFPKPYEKYLTIYTYDQPLEMVNNIDSFSSGWSVAIKDEDTIWPINYMFDLLMDISDSPTPPVSIENGNFWLRLELTEEALQMNRWSLSVNPASGQICDSNFRFYSYYLGSDRNQVNGWFIYGSIPQKTKLDLTLRNEEAELNFQLSVTPVKLDPAIQDANNQFTESLVNKIVNDEEIYSLLRNAVSTEESAEYYRIAVSENAYLAELETRFDANIYLLEWFANGSHTQKRIAYALLSQDVYQESLSEIQKHSYLRLGESYNSISLEAATTYTSFELLRYLLTQEHLCNTLAGIYLPVSYDQLKKEYPALAELSRRDNVISVLMREPIEGQNKKDAVNMLLIYHKDDMTPTQEANYLLRNYISCSNPESPISIKEMSEDSTTEELIRGLILDSGIGSLFLSASSKAVRELIYNTAISSDDYIYSLRYEMVRRRDFVETLFYLVDEVFSVLSSEIYMLGAFMQLSEVQHFMTDEQIKTFEEMYNDLILTYPLGGGQLYG